MNKKIYLLGVGGHGRVVLDTLLDNGVQVTGILDSEIKLGDKVFGIPILGGDEFLQNIDCSSVLLVNGLGANPKTSNRSSLFNRVKKQGFSFLSIKHSSAVLGRECSLSEGTQIMAGSVLQSRVKLHNNSVINTCVSVDHDCEIGTHVFISPGAVLCGQVYIGNASFIGAGSVILPSLKIGERVVVGAGTIVTKNVPDDTVILGNPKKNSYTSSYSG